jgi:hypothetical protein
MNSDKLASAHSQYGQAEWIYDLLTRLGVSSGTIFEAGAGGVNNLSNSAKFIRSGYICYLVESNPDMISQWLPFASQKIFVIQKTVPLHDRSLDTIFAELSLQPTFEVLFLDLDGWEYHLVKGMRRFRPKIICIETDALFPLNISFIPNRSDYFRSVSQASSLATYKMLLDKGYVYLKSYLQDMIFIDSAFFAEHYSFFKNNVGYGQDSFATSARKAVYNPFVTILNQKEPSVGFDLYHNRIEALMNQGKYLDAANLYENVNQALDLYSLLLSNQTLAFQESFSSHSMEFRTKTFSRIYNQLLNLPI